MNIHFQKPFSFRTGFSVVMIFIIFGISGGFSFVFPAVFAESEISVGEYPETPPEPAGVYLGPSALEFLDDDTLCVLHRDARRLDIFSLSTQTVLRSLSLPTLPNKMLKVEHGENPDAELPSGTRIYVSCGDLNGEVLEIDPFSMMILRRWQGIHTPAALAYAKSTGTLFIARQFHSDIFLVDIRLEPRAALEAAPKVKVVREPTAMVLAPDESRLYVANLLPNVPSNGPVVAADISILDTKTHAVKNVQLTDGTASVRDICVTPDGKYVFAVHVSSNHRAITSQLSGGWTNRNGMTILDVEKDDYICCYLVDEHLLGAPNPWSVRVSPDGKLLAITFGGCQEVGFLGVDELISRMYRDLTGISSGYKMVLNVGSLMQTLKMVHRNEIVGPRALVMNDHLTVAAGYFSDNLMIFLREDSPEKSRISTTSGRSYGTFAQFTSLEPEIVPLGPPPVLDAIRRGEIHFHDAQLAQERWHSCATCHPDARVDGMNWDLLNDGLGNHKNTKNMLHAYETPPCMITGVRANAEIATRAGFIHIHFVPQKESLYRDVDVYLKALRPIPGIALSPDGTLTESGKRGHKLFFSHRTGCSDCHYGQYFTDMKMHDVLTKNASDYDGIFDTPTLIETFRTGPYLHDGRYVTLEELLYKGYHGDPEKRLDLLTEQEKADLIEYLLSL